MAYLHEATKDAALPAHGLTVKQETFVLSILLFDEDCSPLLDAIILCYYLESL
jgi:hypothetical protein